MTMKILANFCSCLLLLLLLGQSTFTHATNAKAEIRQLSKIHLMAGPFGWSAGGFGACSATCGGGTQNQVVTCIDLMTQQVVADTNCAGAGAKPATSQACGVGTCSGGTVNPAACATPCIGNTKCVATKAGAPGSCVCTHGFGGIAATGCTIAPSITIDPAVPLPTSAVPNTTLSMKWTTTGTIPTVQILLQDITQPVGQYLTRSTPNTGAYSYTIPTTITAGTYQFVIVPNIPDNTVPPSALSTQPTLTAMSTPVTVTDQCTATAMTCLNGGTCIAGACSCPRGFTGLACELPLCTITSCNNGLGTCDPATGACSNCKNGFHGLNCEIPASCPQTCNGNGTPNNVALCTATTAATTTCTCNGLWMGLTCNVCGLTCTNGGMPSPTCTSCMCPNGFSGPTCSQSTKSEFTMRLIAANATAYSSLLENDLITDLTFAANVSTSSLTVSRVVIAPAPATPMLNYFKTFATGVTATNNVYLYVVMNDMTSTNVQSSMLYQSIQSQIPVQTSLLYSSVTSTLIDAAFGAQAGDTAPVLNNGGTTTALQGTTLIALLTVTLLLFGSIIIVSGIMIYREKEKPKTREFRKDISDDIPDRTDPFIQDLGNNRARIDATPYEWQPPRDASLYPYKPHQGEGAQYLRDFILGTNDGLLSTLLIVVGLVGGGSSSKVILLAAIASAISGSIAMGLGEYIATKSQNEVLVGEEELDQLHFKYHRDREITLLRGYLKSIGIYQPILEPVVRKVAMNDQSLMAIMKRFKFGGEANEDLERNPFKAMFMSGRLFFIGSLPSIFPFFINDPVVALWVALILCGTALYVVGIYKTKTTGGSPWRSGLENLVLGAIAAGLSFAVGKIYDEIRIAIGQ